MPPGHCQQVTADREMLIPMSQNVKSWADYAGILNAAEWFYGWLKRWFQVVCLPKVASLTNLIV